MKRKYFISKINLKKQRKIYYVLIGLALTALLFGVLFIFLLNDSNLLLITESINKYFKSIELGNINILIKNLINNSSYIILIWILGISIIGIPIILLLLLFKSFIFGFSLSSIIYTFKGKGILLSLAYFFPNKIIYFITLLLITFYSLSFSIKLFHFLFLKKQINFKESMNKYLKILIISLISSLLISIYETFITSYILKFFNI
ncbi:MAG: stage II sporulation protein M [Bacilli bacterium]|nr:stage II sporulation protein M [Bacilli bacterium]